MSLETRTSSALFKRAEQLRRWEESETAREPINHSDRPKKIKFSADCVFLAACKGGDREEILRLLKKGADIDTTDVDGLTALHQACIDDNLEMVEFLVENGADVNKGDNEGWTPLHATASCGLLSVARYLIEKGANVAAVNNDGELPVDVAEANEMEAMLQKELDELGIDPDAVRNEEKELMLADAKNWLSSGYYGEKPHPKTGATALHVAAAKGYQKVMEILIKAGADVNCQDLDGWTPLHAAAYWEQKEAAEILFEANCDLGIENYVGQTASDVAVNEMVRVLERLKEKQGKRENSDKRPSFNKISPNQKAVISDRLTAKSDKSSDKEETSEDSSDKSPGVPKQVELQIQSPKKEVPPSEPSSPVSNAHQNQSTIDTDDDEVLSESTETSDTDKSTDVSDGDVEDEPEKKNRANKDESLRLPTTAEANKTVPTIQNKQDDNSAVWRRPRAKIQDIFQSALTLKLSDKERQTGSGPGSTTSSIARPNALRADPSQEVSLRRTQSFEADRTRLAQSTESTRRASETTAPETSTASTPSTPSPAPLSSAVTSSTPVASPVPEPTSPQAVTPQVRSVTPSTPTTPGGSKLSPANIFKNFFKSFVPPVRDEESETQRKAHAKRVRETRRSTQGVTLEEIKSAEQLVKKKNQQILQQASQQLGNSEPSDEVVVKVHRDPAAPAQPPPPGGVAATGGGTNSADGGSTSPPVITATLTRGPNGQASFATEERRPSWRLRVDNGSKFMLEDARKGDSLSGASNSSNDVVRKTAIATPVTETGDTTVTLPLRKPRAEEKDEKESDSRNALATQAAIQRRRRPKRRSTGVVHVDMDEIDPERQSDNSGGTSPCGDGDTIPGNSLKSGGENLDSPSRLNSEPPSSRVDRSTTLERGGATENGEIDYKKLYEESQIENERLRGKLKQTEEELTETKAASEKNAALATRNSMSETEKRERRAMERKLSEMEEELKQLDQLKCENQRLKDENGALIRVISKLSK